MSMTLATAIVQTILDFHKKGQDFSAWEVTNEIRQRALDPMFFLSDEVEATPGVERYNIPHEIVRGQVHELFYAGLMDVLNYERINGPSGVYIIYRPKECPTKSPVNPTAKKTKIGAKRTGQLLGASPILQYIQKNKGTTVKKIQSRFRDSKFSRAEIRDFLSNQGFFIKRVKQAKGEALEVVV